MLTEPRERWHCFSIINLSSRFYIHPKRKNRIKPDAFGKTHIFVSKLACGNSKGMRGDSRSKLCLREEHRLLQSVWKGVNKMQKSRIMLRTESIQCMNEYTHASEIQGAFLSRSKTLLKPVIFQVSVSNGQPCTTVLYYLTVPYIYFIWLPCGCFLWSFSFLTPTDLNTIQAFGPCMKLGLSRPHRWSSVLFGLRDSWVWAVLRGCRADAFHIEKAYMPLYLELQMGGFQDPRTPASLVFLQRAEVLCLAVKWL